MTTEEAKKNGFIPKFHIDQKVIYKNKEYKIKEIFFYSTNKNEFAYVLKNYNLWVYESSLKGVENEK